MASPNGLVSFVLLFGTLANAKLIMPVANAIEKHMRSFQPPIIGRIENDVFMMDMRTVADEELTIIAEAISALTVQ